MERQPVCCDRRSWVMDRVPSLSMRHPWLVTHNLQDEEDDARYQIFCTIPDSDDHHYHCQIPQFLGREIRACFHGWVILSKFPYRVEWCLWNPATSKFIRLPPLVTGEEHRNFIHASCLSSPPPDPASVLLLLRLDAPCIVFCHLRKKRQRLRWTQMSYAEQLRIINGADEDSLDNLICCNGKVYGATACGNVLLVDIIMVTSRQVFIRLLPFVRFPHPPIACRYFTFLKESSAQLVAIFYCYKGGRRKREFRALYLFKLDMATRLWEAIDNVKDRIFFLDLYGEHSLNYSPAIEAESGGYVHIFDRLTKICSYNIQDKTISLCAPPCLDLDLPQIRGAFRPSHISVWVMPECCRLKCDDQQARCATQVQGQEEGMPLRLKDEVESDSMTNKQRMEACLLDLPFHILEMIAQHCFAVEYLNFRAACKCCRLAAPRIEWSTGTALERLQTHSLVSPWLMMLDKDRGIITFTNPLSGDKYFMNTFPQSIGQAIICSSRYGWLLIFSGSQSLVFFNPFTRATHPLPPVPAHESRFKSFGFSAPPTSPDCMVVGFLKPLYEWQAIITSPAEPEWRRIYLGFDDIPYNPSSYHWLTFCGQDLYVFRSKGGLGILRQFGGDYVWEIILARPYVRSNVTYDWPPFLVECGHDLLLIFVGEVGESVEVLKLNPCTLIWEEVNDLGRHMIYVSDTTCFSAIAKTREMENKIYFPMFHAGNGNIVFYSLATRKYHTFKGNGRNKQEETFTDFFPAKKQLLGVWIEPSWSS